MSNLSMSRRNFIQTGAATGVALAAGLALSRSAHAQGREEIKIGMIGSGGRCGGAALESMNADPCVKLVAACDVFEDRVKNKRNILAAAKPDQVRCPDEHCFWDFDGYQKVIELSDIVLIACASKFHPMYTEAAIKAGKHVFVEKPQAIDPPGVRRIEAACKLAEEKGLSVMSGLQSRWSLAWQDIMKRIHDGEIGDIVAMQSMFLRGPYELVGRKPSLTETEYQFSNWYHFCWLSGDDVTQSLVHNVDRMGWAMKGELPEWAFATAGRSGSFGEIYGDMFDHASVVYEYKSGVRLYALCRTTSGCFNDSSDIIMGSKATCLLGQSRFVKRSGEEIYRYSGPGNNPYQTEQDELIKAVKTNTPINCGDFMCNSTMVGVLGQIAAYQGNAVKYEDAYKADFHFGGIEPDGVSMATPPPTLPDETGNYPIPLPGKSRFV
ncbi:MAG: Gfo/Idh/MocA family oxidoreductase [Planctomycetaceae bacterium]|nr:Gfo/Idh/MocA family oxidoreductase [Planctomycetaceae bacterium]